jgi:pimeloyl-ACP methyl ester carboxylesterase
MEKVMADHAKPRLSWPFGWDAFVAGQEYWRDACERSILLLDVLRQRGNNYVERTEQTAPHVLTFSAEVVMDGRKLERPVNYALVRIVPPVGTKIDPRKRPFIVFDPRAGHGPGIGGMKHDSEIGVALKAGHPCYFVGFLPEPVPGQTIADVCAAEARFVEEVIALSPEAEGKPVLIGNCQAGWQIMMMAAMHPDLPGPIMLAGSPLSYWAGVRGKNPMRYLGGLLGGTWLTALAGDLGNGTFDGANLVANFEVMHPSNTWWTKPYNVYSKVDTEAKRFLEFEKWWGSPVLLNAEEMQTIADGLFVGNKLASGQLRTQQGMRVDLREIRSPIIVFCSWGDDITPPQQALHWILDLYEHDEEIVAAGQTIVYCLHQSIGHLGIFVSGKVASKEHGELAQAMDLIDLAPPGLYEAVITGLDEHLEHRELVGGNYLFFLEKRTLDDIRALGENKTEDDQRFATAARVSEINLGLYRRFASPAVKALASQDSAEFLRHAHPNRMRFELFSDKNPFMQPIAAWADQVRSDRHPAAADNPFTALGQETSKWIVQTLDAWTTMRDTLQESIFLGVYGSPMLQALVGLGTNSSMGGRRIARDLGREKAAARLSSDLLKQIDRGGLAEAGVRAMIYVRMAEGRIDERTFAALKQFAAEHKGPHVGFLRFKEIVRKQYLMLLMHQEQALTALPKLLPPDREQRAVMLDIVRRVVTARGALPKDSLRRLNEVEVLFDVGQAPRPARHRKPATGHSRMGDEDAA